MCNVCAKMGHVLKNIYIYSKFNNKLVSDKAMSSAHIFFYVIMNSNFKLLYSIFLSVGTFFISRPKLYTIDTVTSCLYTEIKHT